MATAAFDPKQFNGGKAGFGQAAYEKAKAAGFNETQIAAGLAQNKMQMGDKLATNSTFGQTDDHGNFQHYKAFTQAADDPFPGATDYAAGPKMGGANTWKEYQSALWSGTPDYGGSAPSKPASAGGRQSHTEQPSAQDARHQAKVDHLKASMASISDQNDLWGTGGKDPNPARQGERDAFAAKLRAAKVARGQADAPIAQPGAGSSTGAGSNGTSTDVGLGTGSTTTGSTTGGSTGSTTGSDGTGFKSAFQMRPEGMGIKEWWDKRRAERVGGSKRMAGDAVAQAAVEGV